MKKRYLLTGLLAALLATGLTACDNGSAKEPDKSTDTGSVETGGSSSIETESNESTKTEVVATLSSISVSGGTKEFFVGDEFSKGDLKVTATYSDGSTKDVTADATVTPGAMDKAGTVSVKVSFDGKECTYDITVKAPNVKTYTGLKLVPENSKLVFGVGDEPKAADFKLLALFDNTIGGPTEEAITDLENVTIAIKDGLTFNKPGNYTVVATYNEKTLDINVKVESQLLSIVDKAYDNKDKILSGKYDNGSNAYDYTYGNGFFKYTKEDVAFDDEYNEHPALIENYIFFYNDALTGVKKTTLTDTQAVLNDYLYTESELEINGIADIDLFNYTSATYGAEDALKQLIELGLTNPNNDYKENVNKDDNGKVTGYGFSYSAKVGGLTMAYNVSFTMDGDTLQLLKVNAKSLDDDGAVILDYNVSFDQSAGTRSSDMGFDYNSLLYSSFDLELDGEKLENNATITLDVNSSIDIAVTNMLPATANSSIDIVSVESPSVYTWGYYSMGVVNISGNAPTETDPKTGKAIPEVVVIHTTNVTYTINVIVNEAAPSEITPNVYQEIDKDYSDFVPVQGVYQVLPNTEIFTCGMVESGYKPEYSVTATFEGTDITDKLVLVEDPRCGTSGKGYKFNCTELGTYVVTFVSEADPTVTATLTVKCVSQIIVIEELSYDLQGNYEDTYGNKIVINAQNCIWNNETYELVANDNNTAFAFEANGNRLSFTVEADGSLMMTDSSGNSYTFKAEVPFDDMLVGTYLTADGTGKIEIYYIPGTEGWAFDVDGVYGECISWDGTSTIDVNVDGMPAQATYSGDPFEGYTIVYNDVEYYFSA